MTTTTHTPAEANRIAALKLIAAGKSLAGVHAATLRSLEQKQLAEQRNGVWHLLDAGKLLLGEQAGGFVLQYQLGGNWKPVLQRAGTETRFAAESEAEAAASTVSIVNLYPVRIVEIGDPEPLIYVVYDFGRRYLEHSDGTRTAEPPPIRANDDGDNSSFLQFVIEKRARHWANAGAFLPWAPARAIRYVDLQDALDAARAAAADDTDAYEYRVAIDDLPALPPVIFCQQREEPDLGLLDTLADIAAAGQAQEGPTRTRKAMGIGSMLAAWAMNNVDLVLDAMRVAGDTTSKAAEMSASEFYDRL